MKSKHQASASELGHRLRDYRAAAGLTLRELSEALGRPTANVHRLETAEREATETEIVHYMATCGAPYSDVLKMLDAWREAHDLRGYWLCPHPQWMDDSLRSLIFHEAKANHSVSYEPEFIPGLLQTEPYMRALLTGLGRSGDLLEAQVRARTDRQGILFRKNPAKFMFYIHERALRMEIGSYQIMTEQLLAMMFFADQSNIAIRVVPAAARERGSFGGPFRLFGFAKYHTLAYLAGPVGGLLLEDREYVAGIRSLNGQVADIALDTGESRLLLAKLADEFDRSEGSWDGPRQVAQEQL
jgi:transcriptional regulator with XRE-family HTH domain